MTPLPFIVTLPEEVTYTPVINNAPDIVFDVRVPNNFPTLVVTPIPYDSNTLQGVNLASDVVDISFRNPSDPEIPQRFQVEVCLKGTVQEGDRCLGFYNERHNPPRWECEDTCVEANDEGYYCGKTSHFTYFALLLRGGAEWKGCKAGRDYVTGSYEGDLILTAACVAAMLCFGCFIILMASTSTSGGRFCRGKEGYRIERLRSRRTV